MEMIISYVHLDLGMNNARDEPTKLAFLYFPLLQYIEGDEFWDSTTLVT